MDTLLKESVFLIGFSVLAPRCRTSVFIMRLSRWMKRGICKISSLSEDASLLHERVRVGRHLLNLHLHKHNTTMAAPREDIVPGTVHLVDTQHEMRSRHLEGNKDIVLVPQPSNDPEDPLNWSPSRKALAIGMAYAYTLGVGISTAVQYSGASNQCARQQNHQPHDR